MQLLALCSGGKDSMYALWLALKAGHRVKKIIAVLPTEDSLMYHYPNAHLAELLEKCTGIPVIAVTAKKGEKEEMDALKMVLNQQAAEGIISGAIASNYQKRRLDAICRELGLEHFAPLWGRDPAELLTEVLTAGFEIMVVGVAADGLGEEWLGRRLDKEAAEEMLKLSKKHGINPCGEGGEYETLVTDAPFFVRRIVVKEGERVWKGTHGIYLIKRVELEEKG
ncbi:MAG: diphthine--ammonia ligase [Candidatus Hadarchaeales archaeon]